MYSVFIPWGFLIIGSLSAKRDTLYCTNRLNNNVIGITIVFYNVYTIQCTFIEFGISHLDPSFWFSCFQCGYMWILWI